MWAIEDCRHVSGALERFLLARGERVVRVPPRLMAGARDSARERGSCMSPPVPAVLFAVRFRVTSSPATVTVSPDAWSLAVFGPEEESEPPHAATPTARTDTKQTQASAREERKNMDHTMDAVPKENLRTSEEFGEHVDVLSAVIAASAARTSATGWRAARAAASGATAIAASAASPASAAMTPRPSSV